MHGGGHQKEVDKQQKHRKRAACQRKQLAGQIVKGLASVIQENIVKRPGNDHAVNIPVGKIIKADGIPERGQKSE
ncbi:hypothetical protein IMSAGC013_02652 [Lachnospiraceae bacterium]|nr:hypothetical protein IMSAGC013_02652 [Lachnospiraceae bacterium]